MTRNSIFFQRCDHDATEVLSGALDVRPALRRSLTCAVASGGPRGQALLRVPAGTLTDTLSAFPAYGGDRHHGGEGGSHEAASTSSASGFFF